jgi:hypothetical protein
LHPGKLTTSSAAIVGCALIAFTFSEVSVRATNTGKGQKTSPFTHHLKSGEYAWHPEISPLGPVVIIVSLPDQVMNVYRNGVRIGCSTISSGMPGHSTPTGVFTILQKNIKHSSNIFKEASMPFMERLTWSGVALHAGNLPGFPASHGCVRMPVDFSRKLYAVTIDGTTVIITDQRLALVTNTTPSLFFGTAHGEIPQPAMPLLVSENASSGPVSIVISSADGVAYIYRNGIEIGRAVVGGLNGMKGLYVYSALNDVDAEGRRSWFSTAALGGRAPNIRGLLKQVSIDRNFLNSVRALITQGTTLILTDAPVSFNIHRNSAFDVFTTGTVLPW